MWKVADNRWSKDEGIKRLRTHSAAKFCNSVTEVKAGLGCIGSKKSWIQEGKAKIFA